MATKETPKPKAPRPSAGKSKPSAVKKPVSARKSAAAPAPKDAVIDAVAVEVVDKKPQPEKPPAPKTVAQPSTNAGRDGGASPKPNATPAAKSSALTPAILGFALALVIAIAVFVFFGRANDGIAERNNIEIRLVLDEINELKQRLEGQKPTEPVDYSQAFAALSDDLDAIRSQIEANQASVGALSDELSALAATVAEIELTPVSTDAADLSAQRALLEQQAKDFEAETARLRAAADAAEARVAGLKETVDLSTAQANAIVALATIQSALETGVGYRDAVTTLSNSGFDIPSALGGLAETGVPTLAALIAIFPTNARAAILAEDQAAEGGGVTARFATFIKSQVSKRALEPTDGTTASAILSRAEAALRSGDLTGTMAELAALSDPAAAAMENWLAEASARQQALAAFQTLNAGAEN